MCDRYFTDTNVGIAYTFYPDKFHPSVKQKIDNTEKALVWSSFTEYEFRKKFQEINDNIDDFFAEIQNVLANNEVYSYDFFKKNVLRNTQDIEIDDNKKIELLKFIWNSDKFNSMFPQSLSKLTCELMSCFNQEKNIFVGKMELFDCGRNNYKNFPDVLDKLKNQIDVHKPDYIIVIDANVFSANEPIIFLTCDEELFLKINNAGFLNIQGYELIKKAN